MANGNIGKKNTLTTPEWIVMSALWGREPQVLGEIIETIGDTMDTICKGGFWVNYL